MDRKKKQKKIPLSHDDLIKIIAEWEVKGATYETLDDFVRYIMLKFM